MTPFSSANPYDHRKIESLDEIKAKHQIRYASAMETQPHNTIPAFAR
jgi:hypothetical protein